MLVREEGVFNSFSLFFSDHLLGQRGSPHSPNTKSKQPKLKPCKISVFSDPTYSLHFSSSSPSSKNKMIKQNKLTKLLNVIILVNNLIFFYKIRCMVGVKHKFLTVDREILLNS